MISFSNIILICWVSNLVEIIIFLITIPGITEMNVEPYDEDLGTGDLRYIQVTNTTNNSMHGKKYLWL